MTTVCVCFVCQASGLGGMAVAGHDADQVEMMKPVKERVIKITFNADRHASMQWNFRPQQTEIFVRPGSSSALIYLLNLFSLYLFALIKSEFCTRDPFWS